jgi:hypothetical protein
MWMRLETLHPKALGTPTEVLFFFGCTGLVVQAAGLVTVYGWAVAGCVLWLGAVLQFSSKFFICHESWATYN